MILCLDVGNTHIYAGLVDQGNIGLRFRYPSKQAYTSDQLGIFLRHVLRENGIDPKQVKQVAVASVVPSLDYSLRSACIKYLACEPFVLQSGVKTGLKISTAQPSQVGADLVASAIAGIHRYPDQPLIIVDFGTATSFIAVDHKATFLGSVFIPGVETSMRALQQSACQLPAVEIIKPQQMLGRHTMQSIQSGLYHMQLACLKNIVPDLINECFSTHKKECVVLGTGGFSQLYSTCGVFTEICPDLVLEGIYWAYCKNKSLDDDSTISDSVEGAVN